MAVDTNNKAATEKETKAVDKKTAEDQAKAAKAIADKKAAEKLATKDQEETDGKATESQTTKETAKTAKIPAFLAPYVKAYPKEKAFLVTSDKQVFLTSAANLATLHQNSLKNGGKVEILNV